MNEIISTYAVEFASEIQALAKFTFGTVTVEGTGGNVVAIKVDLTHDDNSLVDYALFTNTEDGLMGHEDGQTWTCGIYDSEDECVMYGEAEDITQALDRAESAWRMEINSRG